MNSNLYHNLVNYVMESFIAGTVCGALSDIFVIHNAEYDQKLVNLAVSEAEETLRSAGAIS